MGGNPNAGISNNNNRRPLGNIVNRVFESAGPDGKVRGTPQQIIDKYQALARDAQLAGDRVAAESFLQHSEHYSRMLGEAQVQQPDTRQGFERDESQRDDGRRDDGRRDDARRDDGRREDARPDDARRDDPRREDGGRDSGRGEGFDQPRAARPENPPQQPDRQPERQPQPAFSSGLAMIDPDEDGEIGGLIDTPESAAVPPSPKLAPATEPAPNGGVNGAHHAAAGGPAEDAAPRETPKRARPRRKARPDDAPAQSE